MITPIFPKLEDVNLTEYAEDSSYEEYSGIVLDPEDNLFKTISGMFRDKKDFYEKLTARGYIVRKVFEKKVFDWIEKNAKTTLEAYLMFSTAFSKWKGNNLLDSYYIQLLNDIPQLNREREKGDPNSIGKKSESVQNLTEEGKGYTLSIIPHYFKYQDGKPVKDEEGNKVEDTALSTPLDIKSVAFNPNLMPSNSQFNTTNQWNDFIRSGQTKEGESLLDVIKREVIPAQLDSDGRPVNGANANPLFVKSTAERDNVTPTYFTFKINGETLKDKEGKPIQYNKAAVLNSTNEIAKKPNASSFAGRNTTNALNTTRDLVQASIGQSNFDRNDLLQSKTAPALISQGAIDSINPEQILNNAFSAIEDNNLESGAIEKARKNLLANATDYNSMKTFFYKKNLNSLIDYIKQDKTAFEKYKTEKGKLKPGKDNEKILEIDRAMNEILSKYKPNDAGYNTVHKIMQADLDKSPNVLDKLTNSDLRDIYLAGDLDAQNRIDAAAQLRNNYVSDVNPTNTSNDNNTKIAKDLGIKTGGYRSKLVNNDDKKQIKDIINQGIKLSDKEKEELLNQEDDKFKRAVHNANMSKWRREFNKAKTESIVESDERIPLVDDPTQTKYVNYNASQSYANQPVDGVVTNPGAIPTSGQYMYEEEDDSLDWVQVHKQLNQNLFDGTVLREDVREAFLDIAAKFKATLSLNIEPIDLYFTGSSANYNYTPVSDIDLHLVYNFEEIGVNAEILTKYFIAKKQLFNSNYSINVKGLPVEMGVENINEPIVSSAIYSVIEDKWLLEPEAVEKVLPRLDTDMFYSLVQEIEDAIETHDSKEIGKVWDKLYDIRKDSLAKEGEFGKGNAIFKRLRNLGYLDRIKKAYYSNASDELSLESLREMEI